MAFERKEKVTFREKPGSLTGRKWPEIEQGPRNEGDKHWGMRSKKRILKDYIAKHGNPNAHLNKNRKKGE